MPNHTDAGSGSLNIYAIDRLFRSLRGATRKFADYVSTLFITFDDKQLLASANQTSVPIPFKPFIRLMEHSLDREIPTDFTFTREEVIESDDKAALSYSIPSYDFSQLNYSYLINAAAITFDELGFNDYKFRPRSPRESAESFPSKSNSGYPLFGKKGDETVRDKTVEWVQSFLNRPVLFHLLTQPTACFHRFQYKVDDAGNIDKKIRQVWALPFNILTLQGCLFRDLVEHCTSYARENGNYITPWGLKGNPEISDVVITRFRFMQKSLRCRLISLDVQSFDQSVPTWLYPLFFSGISSVLPKDKFQLTKLLMAYETFTPYVLRTGDLRFQRRGIPSGSLLTQLFGTFVTRLIINYTFLEQTKGRHSAKQFANCLGDDNLVLEHMVTYPHLLSVYKRFGLTISTKKTKITKVGQPFDYLGVTWDTENRPTKPESWYIARFACPSRFIFKSDLSMDEYQTNRCLSTIMPMYRGLETFERLVGFGDRVYQALLLDMLNGKPAIIKEVNPDGSVTGTTIPLLKLKIHGWRLSRPELDTGGANLDFGFM